MEVHDNTILIGVLYAQFGLYFTGRGEESHLISLSLVACAFNIIVVTCWRRRRLGMIHGWQWVTLINCAGAGGRERDLKKCKLQIVEYASGGQVLFDQQSTVFLSCHYVYFVA